MCNLINTHTHTHTYAPKHTHPLLGLSLWPLSLRSEVDQTPAEPERGPSRAPVPLGSSLVGGAGPVHAEQLDLAVERAGGYDGGDVGGPGHLVPSLSSLPVPSEHLV